MVVEEQSGSSDGKETNSTLVRVTNITSSPNPESRPFTSDPSNVKWVKETKATARTMRQSSQLIAMKQLENTLTSNLNQGFETMNSTMNAILQTLKASPPTPLATSSTDWSPLISSIAALCSLTPIIVVKYLGLDPTVLQPSSASTPGEVQVPSTMKALESRMNQLESKIVNIESNIKNDISALEEKHVNLDARLDSIQEGQAQILA